MPWDELPLALTFDDVLIQPGRSEVHPNQVDLRTELCRGISLNISYPWPVHTMSGFVHLGVPEGALPHTEALAKEIFSLPMYPSLTPALQDKVIGALHTVLAAM